MQLVLSRGSPESPRIRLARSLGDGSGEGRSSGASPGLEMQIGSAPEAMGPGTYAILPASCSQKQRLGLPKSN